jgi:putative nucleotidyltransferase with HDIG domain
VVTQFRDIDHSFIDMEEFWRHSIGVGIAARVIASYQSEPNVERFYLMGLLHDIGRIIMVTQIPELMSGLIAQCRERHQMLYLSEQQQLGFDHGVVGMQLLQHWKLPAVMCNAVGYHHHAQHSRDYAREASIIHIADLLVNGLQLGTTNGIPLVPPLHEPAWDTIGLSTALLPDILGHIEHQYHDVVEIFLS